MLLVKCLSLILFNAFYQCQNNLQQHAKLPSTFPRYFLLPKSPTLRVGRVSVVEKSTDRLVKVAENHVLHSPKTCPSAFFFPLNLELPKLL